MNLNGEAAVAHSLADRYEALIRISQAVSVHRDLKEALRVMKTELQRIVPFNGLVITQIDSTSGEITWHVLEPEGDSRSSLPDIAADLVRWVFETQEPIAIPCLAEEARFGDFVSLLRKLGIQSLCTLPLTTVHRRIGTIGLGSKRLNAYDDEDRRFLSLVADQVALAMDNALNFEASNAAQAALTSNNERLQLLLRVNNAVVSNLELRELLLAISASIRSVMQCDGVGVALPDSDGQLQGYVLDFPDRGFVPQHAEMPIEIKRVFQTGVAGTYLSGDETEFKTLAEAEGLNSVYNFPLIGRQRTLGVLGLLRRAPVPFAQQELGLLREIGTQVSIAIENALAYREIAELKDRLAQEKVYLEGEIRSELNFEEILGKSEVLRRVLKQVETVAPTDSTVLIYGDTGTGKELIARALHNLSSRAKRAFVKLNCAAIPTGLLESELFGHERGAFTGAVSQRIGRFELGNQGTVFLDEVGEIPLELQPKLLRVLQEREFERLGSSHTLKSDARLIAATNRDLTALVAEGKFRADLFYRLSVFPLYIPPLRDRREDIPLLVRHFVQHFARRMNKVIETIPSETMNALVHYDWPGNVRELQNFVERAVILSTRPVLNVSVPDLPARSVPAAGTRKFETLEDAERQHILSALDAAGWVIAGGNGAAALLGLKRSTLQARMEKLGIRRARTAG
jgi:formate hydrogenlyase transcriptional activator